MSHVYCSSYLDRGLDWVLEGDVHGGVVSLLHAHLHLAVGHPVEADVELQVDGVRHLHLHLGARAHVEADVDRGVVGLGLLDGDVATHGVVVPNVD